MKFDKLTEFWLAMFLLATRFASPLVSRRWNGHAGYLPLVISNQYYPFYNGFVLLSFTTQVGPWFFVVIL